jgi:CheY-like chemotaxis protein
VRILIVEDHAPTVELLAETLAGDGHVVVTEQNGRSGRDRAIAESFDLILCDVGLPDLDGLAIARAIRSAGIQVPLLALSGRISDDERLAGLTAGFDTYLTKPITASALLREIGVHEALGGWRRASRAAVAQPPAQAVASAPSRRRGVLSGLVVMAVGITFVLQAAGVPGASAYLFITLGAAFGIAYSRSNRQYVYLVPAAVFTSFGVALLLPTWFVLRPEVIAPSFVGFLALGLFAVSVLAPDRRWPLVPASLLGAVALVDLIGGISIIPNAVAPFFVPGVLLGVGAYLLIEPTG